jgi:hypothetical protein
METNYNINTINNPSKPTTTQKKPDTILSNIFYFFSKSGPPIKVIYVIAISYIIVVMNDKNKYINILYFLLFIYAFGCILNSIKYYYTDVNCNHSNAYFLKTTQYANIGYAVIIILFMFYGIFIKK